MSPSGPRLDSHVVARKIFSQRQHSHFEFLRFLFLLSSQMHLIKVLETTVVIDFHGEDNKRFSEEILIL